MATQQGDFAANSNRMVCVDDFERFTVKSLESSILGYIQSGADNEVTLEDNIAAFRR